MDEDTLRQVAQIEDLTRDARTVFVGSLVQRADEEWVRKYFEQAGPVEVVRVIRDRHGRSRGHAYVEFTNLDDIPKVLILHGQPMCMTHEGCTCSGFPVVVQPSGAERNYAKSAADDDAALIKTAKRTYIGNVPTGIPEVSSPSPERSAARVVSWGTSWPLCASHTPPPTLTPTPTIPAERSASPLLAVRGGCGHPRVPCAGG